jgi:hypothetical protein
MHPDCHFDADGRTGTMDGRETRVVFFSHEVRSGYKSGEKIADSFCERKRRERTLAPQIRRQTKRGFSGGSQAARRIVAFGSISVEPFGTGTRIGSGTWQEEEGSWSNLNIRFSTCIRCTHRSMPVAECPVQYTRAQSWKLFLYACSALRIISSSS